MTPNAGDPDIKPKDEIRSLPTRIITYAWGEKYIGELLSIAVPALLAPGNLPAVAAAGPCELVILTQEVSFSRFMTDPAIARIQKLCPVRMIAIDDLIPSPDKYGMALTYILHRGFADLGPDVLKTWLIFLNADFILADGSLRTLVRCFAEGHRLVASPSYCVNADAVTPRLLKRVSLDTKALSMPSREMAALILAHRHNTIRGKTVNQTVLSIRYMDQFYWLANETTLLGHQMPIAIVGMRPERYVAEPNSYWDHGLIREFCPDTEHHVLGDSDDFLMLELRSDAVAQELLQTGWREPAEIARDLRSFLTPYQKDMVRYPLTLHSDELPADAARCREKLKAFIDGIFVHLPAVLPSHIDHPQWDYHKPGFIEGRHKHLSVAVGSMTEDTEPPSYLSELDKAWWRLDGHQKSYSRKRADLEATFDRMREMIVQQRYQMIEELDRRRAEVDARVAKGLSEMRPSAADPLNIIRVARVPGPNTPIVDSFMDSSGGAHETPLSVFEKEMLAFRKMEREHHAMLTKAEADVERRFINQRMALNLEYETSQWQLRSEYDRLVARKIKSAVIPHVALSHGPIKSPASRNVVIGWAKRHYYAWFGKLPRVKMLHPYWAAMRHLVRTVDQSMAGGAQKVLVIVGSTGIADSVADELSGLHARVSLADVLHGNLLKSFETNPQFDLCICSFEISELNQVSELVDAVSPAMRKGSKIICFYPNFSVRPFSSDEMNLLYGSLYFSKPARIYYSGSEESARVVRRFRDALSRGPSGKLGTFGRLATLLLMVAPSALRANKLENGLSAEQISKMPTECTSITIEVTV